MLQRYDISIDNDKDRLSIKEFAAIGRKHRKNEYSDFNLETFSLIHEVSYDGDSIRTAIEEGAEALISEIRSPDFYPIGSCAEAIAETVTDLYTSDTEPDSEAFFDDRTMLTANAEK